MHKQELQEEVIELVRELKKSKLGQAMLRRKNRRLENALKAESKRFAQLESYVQDLRNWLEETIKGKMKDKSKETDES
jgi:hypothetical protein